MKAKTTGVCPMLVSKEGLEKIENLAQEASHKAHCRLYDIEVRGRTLRVFIEKKDQQADLDDCTHVSQSLSLLLDMEDELLKSSYDLEVSTPGVERVLRRFWHFENAIGETMKVTMIKGYPGTKLSFQGQLTGLEDHHLILKTKEQEEKLPFEFVHKAKVIYFHHHQNKNRGHA